VVVCWVFGVLVVVICGEVVVICVVELVRRMAVILAPSDAPPVIPRLVGAIRRVVHDHSVSRTIVHFTRRRCR
jgi:hypothetical protein